MEKYRMAAGDMSLASWEEWRAGRITASVAAGCLGMSEWQSPQQAYRMIVGEQKHVSDWYVINGRKHEPNVAFAYERRTGERPTKTGWWENTDAPWLGASPDRLVGDSGILNIKCCQSKFDTLPLNWRVQAKVELYCTGRQWCDVAWMENGQVVVCRVSRSGVDGLIKRLRWFYRMFVVNREPPEKGQVKRWAKKPRRQAT